MNPDEFQQQFDALLRANVGTAKKVVRRTFWTILAVNFGCLFFSVATITCIILGCLKLFGVI
jgi:hypothetical protein